MLNDSIKQISQSQFHQVFFFGGLISAEHFRRDDSHKGNIATTSGTYLQVKVMHLKELKRMQKSAGISVQPTSVIVLRQRKK